MLEKLYSHPAFPAEGDDATDAGFSQFHECKTILLNTKISQDEPSHRGVGQDEGSAFVTLGSARESPQQVVIKVGLD